MITSASFLAGSLLSLLMPVGLLIAIAIWHALVVKRVPAEGTERAERAPAAAETPPPAGSAPGTAAKP
jgi:hypothetical protein